LKVVREIAKEVPIEEETEKGEETPKESADDDDVEVKDKNEDDDDEDASSKKKKTKTIREKVTDW